MRVRPSAAAARASSQLAATSVPARRTRRRKNLSDVLSALGGTACGATVAAIACVYPAIAGAVPLICAGLIRSFDATNSLCAGFLAAKYAEWYGGQAGLTTADVVELTTDPSLQNFLTVICDFAQQSISGTWSGAETDNLFGNLSEMWFNIVQTAGVFGPSTFSGSFNIPANGVTTGNSGTATGTLIGNKFLATELSAINCNGVYIGTVTSRTISGYFTQTLPLNGCNEDVLQYGTIMLTKVSDTTSPPSSIQRQTAHPGVPLPI
jgi:hypothetical protein